MKRFEMPVEEWLRLQRDPRDTPIKGITAAKLFGKSTDRLEWDRKVREAVARVQKTRA